MPFPYRCPLCNFLQSHTLPYIQQKFFAHFFKSLEYNEVFPLYTNIERSNIFSRTTVSIGVTASDTVRKAPALHLVGIPKPFLALQETGTCYARKKRKVGVKMHEIRINLDDELYFMVKEESARKGMNLSEYFRDLLSKQSGVELVIDFADIDEYVMQIEQLRKKIDAALPTIYRSGKVYEQEAVLIKQIMNQINETGNTVWRYVVAMREEMFDSVRKSLYKTVHQYSYTKRNKKIMDQLEAKYPPNPHTN